MYENILKAYRTFCKLSIFVFLIIAGGACLQDWYAAVADTLQSAACHTSCPTCLDCFQWHFLWTGQGKYARVFLCIWSFFIFGIGCQCLKTGLDGWTGTG